MQSFLNYILPPERIAQRPVAAHGKRSDSKLLDARGGKIADRTFSDLPEMLRSGDLLVLNNTKVLPYRFFAELESSGEEVELLLLSRSGEEGQWEALAKPMRKLKPEAVLHVGQSLRIRVIGRTVGQDRVILSLESTDPGIDLHRALLREGVMPIPPYIREGRGDKEDQIFYQTVFAEVPGSVAAPTAGLHFTPELLATLKSCGIDHTFITLHVGPASFVPLRLNSEGLPEIESHQMAREYYSVPDETRRRIEETRMRGGRVIAVGTTTVRALESDAGRAEASEEIQETTIFIRPGYEFKVVDLMITNFHQPYSTHLLLVAAFIGEDAVRTIYNHALIKDYRFLSYGDAMLLDRRSGHESP